MEKIKKKILREIYQKRPKDSKKYDFGLLVIIGGSQFYSGSPALCALAAFRAGVDMVRILAPKRAADIVASFSPNLAAFPLPGNYLQKDDLSFLLEIIEGAKMVASGKTALVIGGGLGRSDEVQETILELLDKISIPTLLDADAIWALSKRPQILKGKPFLLTPHSFEFFILTGKKIQNLSLKEKAKLLIEESQRLKTTILLKGNPDLISDGKRIAQIKAGTPLMSVGGTGDTLAGIGGALLARGILPFKAGCGAALINGLAGEKAARKFGESMTATDLIEQIPQVLPKI